MDETLLFLINRRWASLAADWFMAAICSWAVWAAPVFLAATAVLVWGGFRGRAAVFVIALATGTGDGLIANPLKSLVARPRPHEVLADVRQVQIARANPAFLGLLRPARAKLSRPGFDEPGGNAFPSSHTMNHFTVAAVLGCLFPRKGWLWLIPAGLIGYARVYTGSHWPSDVLGSALLGLGWGLVCIALGEALWRRFGAPRFPDHPTLLREAAP